MSSTSIPRIFDQIGSSGTLCVEDGTGERRVELGADEPVVAASVIKVLVAVEAERRFATGDVDAQQRVRLPVGHRSPGPVGFSLYDDDVDVSARDLVVAMLTISDNAATDALLEVIGVDACNRTATALGLDNTVLVEPLARSIDSIATAAGFGAWTELVAQAPTLTPAEQARIDNAVRSSAALTPATATRTTAADMCRLLRAIWSDEAAPATACERIRRLMAMQATRDRLASAFAPPVAVAAKSGGLVGLVRNEVGVIDYPDGRRYFAAVFTRRERDSVSPAQINAGIGQLAAVAAAMLDRAVWPGRRSADRRAVGGRTVRRRTGKGPSLR